MITRIHVNRQNVQRNKKGEKLPVFTAKDYISNRKGNEVVIMGPSKLIYSPDKPLKSGAIAWIETQSDVLVFP